MQASGERDEIVTAAFRQKIGRVFIGGEWVRSRSGDMIDVVDPSTEEIVAAIPAGAMDDADAAVQAARRAFANGPWSSMTPGERSNLMLQLADAIDSSAQELAHLESLDAGVPLSFSLWDIGRTAANLRSYAGWANKLTGETPLSSSAHARNFAYSIREPIGVVAAITPWNAPFPMAIGKIAPALAAGCTVVLKPAELTPLSTLKLASLIEEVGFPPGVVNVVTGYGDIVGQALADHPDVNLISFTGSTRVGKKILAAAAGNIKRVTLELGGKSPVVVFADADIDAAATGIAREMCRRAGQYCAAGTRLFADETVFDELVGKIVKRLADIRIGPALDRATEMGPLISERQKSNVLNYVGLAVEAGAKKVAVGKRIESGGYFVQPTVLTNIDREMRAYREEIFGPVLCAMSFPKDADLEEIGALANDTVYGLAAKIWTRDVGIAHRLARKIQAGAITINGGVSDSPQPVGGYKQSGLGRENGREGMQAFTELKSVAIGL